MTALGTIGAPVAPRRHLVAESECDDIVQNMKSALMRQRIVRVTTWTILGVAFIGWVISLAIKAPWTPWFTIAFWAVVAVGLVVRVLTRSRGKRTSLDAFQDLNQIYQGRTQTPAPGHVAAQSVEIGEPFRNSPPSAPDPNEVSGEEEPPLRSQ
ncbi:hypothetical protein GCM10010471_00890 [Leucobacter komagatae]